MSDGAPRGVFHAGEFSPADLAIQINALDQQARLPGIRRLRAWSVVELAPEPDERVLDIGSGTGDHTWALAVVFGEAVGVEPNPGLRAEASRRAPNVRFVDGTAESLPFPDDSFDAVSCERVFQHLDDPSAAASEIARVLRPGGRAVVIDTDWATSIIHPGDPELVGVLSSAMQGRLPNPLAGRRLPGWLSAAGLTVTDIGSQALIQPASAATGPLVRMIARMAMQRGAIDEQQHDQLLADLAQGAETGDFHMSVTMFAVVAHAK